MENQYSIVIIGSGFGGIGIGNKLLNLGIEDFIILERDSAPGGTWWRNTYPGAAVDVQSHLYSFKDEPFNWSRLFAMQPEILDYTNFLLDKYDVRSKVQCNKNVVDVKYIEDRALWSVTCDDKKIYSAPIVINASGSLSQPLIPAIPGLEEFKGKTFHTSRWDHKYDYTNKKVGIIGTGASAVQVVSAIAPKVNKLFVFQRTPHWVLPRPDRSLKMWERAFIHSSSFTRLMFREWMYWKLEARMLAFKGNRALIKIFQARALKYLKKQVPDKELRKKLTPDFMLGCKRVLLTNDYYPALQRDNVFLETDGIVEINENGILTKKGEQINLDLIVFATGFNASENNIPYPVCGRNGMTLEKSWRQGAHAYVGTTVPFFPNYFILVGPNTGIGHTSALHIMESQMNYIMQALNSMRKNHWKSIEIKEEVEKDYNKKIHEKLSKTVWQIGGCKSWYQTRDGKNTTLYPSFSFVFRKDSAKFNSDDHLIVK